MTTSTEAAGMGERHHRVLLIGVGHPYRRELEDHLRKSGCGVATARTAEEALVEVGSAPPDAVIVDLEVARPRGGNFVARLRQRADGHGIPVVLLGDHGHLDEVEAVFGAGGPVIFLRSGARPDRAVTDLQIVIDRARRGAMTQAPAIHVPAL